MKTMKNMFLEKFGDIENFRFFDIDTPIDEKSKKSQKNFFLKNTRKQLFLWFLCIKNMI